MGVGKRIVLAMLALILVACSGKPSDSEVERLFSEQNKTFGLDKILGFEHVHRINGYEQEGQRYIVEMQFDVVMKMGYQEVVEELRRDAPDTFMGRAQLDHNLEVLDKEYGRFQKGDRFTKKRQMALQRTEAGWVLVR